MLGQDCTDSVGAVTCGAGEWCLQEMNVNQGVGVCSSFCDPATVGGCPSGYSCVAVGVALVASAPVIHVCAPTPSDAGIPQVGDDGSTTAPPSAFDGATVPDGALDHPAFDGGPWP
jgi:hypothetical protein